MYKMPIRRRKAARSLAAALRGHGKLIAERLEPRMAKVLEEGEAMPDVPHLLDVLGRVVVAESEELDERDEARSREGSRARWLGKELRQAGRELRSRVVEIRRQMRQLYGARRVERLIEFHGRTPRRLEDLEVLADCMVRRLPGFGSPKAPGVSVDPAAWAAFVREPLEEVQRLMREHEGRSWGEGDAVSLKQTAMAAFDRTYRRVLRLGVMFYRLAGLGRLSETLRSEGGRPAERTRPSGSA